ncbi:MAG: hypothetical protein IJ642_01180 [Oscillospiraceae bacterium]|nr:hypothetical protein [Oscillospiraceae bacterium]
MKIEKVRKFFSDQGIETEELELKPFFKEMHLSELLNEYLELMGKPVRLPQTNEESALSCLLSQDEIEGYLQNEAYKRLREYRLFPLGKGLNGDILCVNLKNGRVGYVYQKGLTEGFEELADIYQELPIELDKFLEVAFYK